MTKKQIRKSIFKGLILSLIFFFVISGQVLAGNCSGGTIDGDEDCWKEEGGVAVHWTSDYKSKPYYCDGCFTEGPNPDAADCWVCNIFELFFDTGNHVAATTSDGLISSCTTLLGVGLGLWLAFHILPIVSSFKAGNAMQTVTDIGKVLLKAVVVVSFFEIGMQPIFDYIISPAVTVAMGVSDKIMNSVNTAETKRIQAEMGNEGGDVEITTIQNVTTPNRMGGGAKAVFDADVRSGMLGIVKNTFATIDYAQSLASYIICESSRPKPISLFGTFSFDFPWLDFKLFLIGINMALIFGLMVIIFPFYIIDAAFRAILICLLSPLFLVAWVFPATAGYASKAFNLFLGCVATFVIMGLIVAVGVRIAIIPLQVDGNDLFSMCGDGDSLPDILRVIEDDVNGVSVFFILICGGIALKYITKVADIVGVFGFEKVEAAVGNKMLKGGAKMAVAAATTAVKAAGAAAGAVGGGDAAKALKETAGKFKASKAGQALGKAGDKLKNSKVGQYAGKAGSAVKSKAAAIGKTATSAAEAINKAVSDSSLMKSKRKLARALKNIAGKVKEVANKVADAVGNSRVGKACKHRHGLKNGTIKPSTAREAYIAGRAEYKQNAKQKRKKKAKDFAKKMVNNMKKSAKDRFNRAVYGDAMVDFASGLSKAKKLGVQASNNVTGKGSDDGDAASPDEQNSNTDQGGGENQNSDNTQTASGTSNASGSNAQNTEGGNGGNPPTPA